MYTTNNLNNTTLKTTAGYSNYSTPARSFVRPVTGTGSHNYLLSQFSDLLTKREYLYRQYLKAKGSTLYLPNDLVSNPTNPLYVELKNSLPLTDPSTFSSEVSRDYLYNSTSFFQINTLNGLFESKALTYPLFYLFGANKPLNIGSNAELFKNQYRPMRKGITNMVRLHATGAIALPTEIRLHILASSKDVIHS
jgi:hypothetical protein